MSTTKTFTDSEILRAFESIKFMTRSDVNARTLAIRRATVRRVMFHGGAIDTKSITKTTKKNRNHVIKALTWAHKKGYISHVDTVKQAKGGDVFVWDIDSQFIENVNSQKENRDA